MAAYSDFLEGVQTKATQLSASPFFKMTVPGRFKKHRTDRAGLCRADRYAYRVLPAKGFVHGHQLCVHRPYPAGIYALTCVDSCAPRARQRLVEFIRSLPGGRLKTAIAKLAAFAASLLVVLMVLYGVNLHIARRRSVWGL